MGPENARKHVVEEISGFIEEISGFVEGRGLLVEKKAGRASHGPTFQQLKDLGA